MGYFGDEVKQLVLVSELDKSTELFLGDELHVLRTMLWERPVTWFTVI
jgi:hypothetical protein